MRLRGRLNVGWNRLAETSAALIFEVFSALALFIIFPLTTRNLGPAGYAKYATVYTIAGLAITWVWANTSVSLVQLLLQRERTLDSSLHAARRQVATMAVPSALIGGVVAVAMLGTDVLVPALLIFGAELLLGGLAELNMSTVYAFQGQQVATRARLVGPAMRVAGVVAIAAAGVLNLVTLAVVNLAAASLLLASSARALRRLRRSHQDPPGAQHATRSELWKLIGAFGVSMSAFTAQNDADKLTMAAFRPAAEVGEYAAAYRLVSTIMLPLRAVFSSAYRWFMPETSRPWHNVNRAVRLVTVGIAYSLLCAVGVFVFQPLTARFLGPEFETAVTITLWLSLFPLFRVMGEVPLLALLGLGRTRERMFIGLGGAVVAVVAYLILVPRYGWGGAVAGTYLSEIATALGAWMVLLWAQRRHDAELCRGSPWPPPAAPDGLDVPLAPAGEMVFIAMEELTEQHPPKREVPDR